MGVLMSKKQQVEKVQKCSAVVSAFQAGIKDRAPTTAKPTEVAEEDDKPAKTSADTDEKNTEETEQGEKDSSAGPSTSQQSSAPARDDCKVNQEAWSRLRDGKGVEPEDLDKSHQLTPPAFVRPKREADDDQPVEVELGKKEQPPSDEMCDVCEVWTADDLYPCRICTRVFHDGCLRELGYLRAEALQEMKDTAHTVTGWSCYYCDNLNLLLTEEEMYSLMETFKQCKIIPESCLVSDELLQYRHFVSKQQFDKDLTDEQEEEVLAQFTALDPEKKGHIEWSDFLYFESLAMLRKFRTENSLVRLLTAKERDNARSVFVGLDLDKDGVITRAECRQAQQSWFHKVNKDSQSCNVRLMGLCSSMNCGISHVGPICESSPASSGSDRSKTDDNRPVTWADFLKESAIYILAARPNSSATHIRMPL
ncbi:PHD finger protein 24 isoform X1 [Sphaeramia orbicularis]|uniref:PHD finger protein 24 isoform X1 n=1 Tax=Sphaeramia orbicularis TaxID=375764 RepID=UPI00117C3E5D|nr:PHD finger protein 24 isoform X1 [Sphaeramia orbicularis]XP_030004836.1 PHD finger protein 24 isoform X1 [Sphaeramia orbicularis]